MTANNFQQEQSKTAMTLSTLEAMCRQECTAYKCEDYLHRHMHPPSSQEDHCIMEQDMQTCINNRAKMSQWCLTLVDACQLSRETVSIAMSNLDRFLATPEGAKTYIDDSSSFQLACMTALYNAIKVHEEKAISPETLAYISRGFYSSEDMEATEWTMLKALKWRVNAPTPLAFCRELLHLAPEHQMDARTQEQVLSLAKVQTELAVQDYSFVTVKASSIAFAALSNATEVMGLKVPVNLNYAMGLIDRVQVSEIQSALYAAVLTLQQPALQLPAPSKALEEEPSPIKHRQSVTISPRTVCGQAA